jgi:hypothetical protein
VAEAGGVNVECRLPQWRPAITLQTTASLLAPPLSVSPAMTKFTGSSGSASCSACSIASGRPSDCEYCCPASYQHEQSAPMNDFK